jgi:hypothetical protein
MQLSAAYTEDGQKVTYVDTLPTAFDGEEVVFLDRVGESVERDGVTAEAAESWFKRHRVGLIPADGVKLVIRRCEDGSLEGLTWRMEGSVADDGDYNVDGIEICPHCPSCAKGEEYVFPVDELPPFRGDYDERNTPEEQRIGRPNHRVRAA